MTSQDSEAAAHFPCLAGSISSELAARRPCVHPQLTHSNWWLSLCSPLQDPLIILSWATLGRSFLSTEARRFAGKRLNLVLQKRRSEKGRPLAPSRGWRRLSRLCGPLARPSISRLAVARNHGDGRSRYLQEGMKWGRRDERSSWLWSLGYQPRRVEGGRAGGGDFAQRARCFPHILSPPEQPEEETRSIARSSWLE